MNLIPGHVVVLTEGEYSDSSTIGYYDVLKPFDTDRETARFKESEAYANVDPDERYLEDFISWLIDANMILESTKHCEWYLGYETLE